MSDSSEARTEPATPERRRRARREGQVAKGRDAVSVATLGAGLGLLVHGAPTNVARLAEWTKSTLQDADPSPASMLDEMVGRLAEAVGPLAGVAALAAVAASVLQTGWVWAPAAVKPQLSRLSLSGGLRRQFSREKLGTLGAHLAKLTAALGLVAWTVIRDAPTIVALAAMPLVRGVEVGAHLLVDFGARLLGLHALIAGLDALWSHHAFARRLRMSRSEVRREHKNAEGDPFAKSRRRELARELLFTGRLDHVRQATVVVVNPVHVAVALAVPPNNPRSPPIVLVKGRSRRARAIRREARRRGVPVVPAPALARALLEVDLGDPIPPSTWDVVADILALLWSEPSGGPVTRGGG